MPSGDWPYWEEQASDWDPTDALERVREYNRTYGEGSQ